MKRVIKVKINRLFHGFSSVRDFTVVEAMKNHKDLLIVCGNEEMFVRWQDLDKGMKNDEVFYSKHNPDQKYSLIDFDFKPNFAQQTLYD